jgi:hypothetical protein
MSFTVRVVNDDGDGIVEARVALTFTRSIRGMTGAEYTDNDGRADFDGYDDGEVEIFVEGRSCGTYDYSDGGEVTITR